MRYIEQYQSGTYRNQGDFCSFIPSSICDDWQWSDSRMNYLFAKANRELGALNTCSELVPDIDTYIQMQILVEANKSSRIEGTKTSIEECLMNPADLAPERRDDVQEVQNYVAALNHGIHRIIEDEFPMTTRLLRELHGILLQGVRGAYKTPGEFRRSQNFIGGSRPGNAVYVPPAVPDMQDLLGDFDKFMNRQDDLPELVRIAVLHCQFESIHPFLDGNGRIGRLAVPLFLLARKELSSPCFHISSFFEQHRTEYYSALQNVRLKNDMLGWICFFLEASIQTAQDARQKFRKAVRFAEENRQYADTKRNQADSIQKVICAMYHTPVATAPMLSRAAVLSLPTVTNVLKTLEQDGLVQEITGNFQNRVYSFVPYLDIFRQISI